MTIHDFGPGLTRRTFLGAAAAAAAPLVAPAAFAAARPRGADPLNVGVIGCGGRGTGAARDALEVSESTRIVALADVFPDRLESCRASLATLGERGRVDERRCHAGFDGYRALLTEDVDVVILAAPPHFRPAHFEAAVAAGKHVFMEKPVAVDPVGARRVMESASAAQGAGLSVVAGTQRRHEASYRAAMAMLRQGVIGEVVAARCYWNMGGLWMNERRPEWSDMEWQLRNWLYFTWLSGDHIVEQHVHNIDVVSWAMGGPPRRALAVGGRQARTDPRYGHVFDHFAVDYEYDGGRFCLSMCRQQDGCPGRVEEIIHGTEGRMTLSPGRAVIEGPRPWRFDGANPNPYVEEHRALQEAIRSGAPVNEARTVAESTLAAIMGRMAAYTGQEVTWEHAMSSTLDLTPPAYELGSLPVPAVAVPGQTKLT
jgi:predicted dehydrogenase